MEKYYYSWVDFDEAIQIALVNKSFNNIDLIVGIAGGGLPLMLKLSKELEINYDIVKCHSYVGEERKELAIDILPHYTSTCNKRILLVDDICDGGHTLKKLKTVLLEGMGAKSVETLVLCYKKHAVVTPDTYLKVIPDEQWVVFPWEKACI